MAELGRGSAKLKRKTCRMIKKYWKKYNIAWD